MYILVYSNIYQYILAYILVYISIYLYILAYLYISIYCHFGSSLAQPLLVRPLSGDDAYRGRLRAVGRSSAAGLRRVRGAALSLNWQARNTTVAATERYGKAGTQVPCCKAWRTQPNQGAAEASGVLAGARFDISGGYAAPQDAEKAVPATGMLSCQCQVAGLSLRLR